MQTQLANTVANFKRSCSTLCVSKGSGNVLIFLLWNTTLNRWDIVSVWTLGLVPLSFQLYKRYRQVWFQGQSVKIILFVSGEQQDGSSPCSLWTVVFFSDAHCLHIFTPLKCIMSWKGYLATNRLCLCNGLNIESCWTASPVLRKKSYAWLVQWCFEFIPQNNSILCRPALQPKHVALNSL